MLICGSSRAWTVEAAWVQPATGLRTFNAAVTAGRPADAYVFSVSSFGGDPAGFFDATHMTRENQRKMIDAALAAAADRLP